MAPHSSTLAWKIPWTEEPGRLQSMGSLRVRPDWAFSLSCIGEGNGSPLQCSCLENPRDGGAWGAAVYGVSWSWTRLKQQQQLPGSRALGLNLWTDVGFRLNVRKYTQVNEGKIYWASIMNLITAWQISQHELLSSWKVKVILWPCQGGISLETTPKHCF